MSSSTNTATVTFGDNPLIKVPTNTSVGSQLSDVSSDTQDWAVTTSDADSWAARERRRSSVWSGLDVPVITKSRTSSTTKKERKGSVLGIWDDGGDEDWAPRNPDGSALRKIRSNSSNKGQDRKGSILSIWKGGVDETGKHVMGHDDHEVAIIERKSVDEDRLSPLGSPASARGFDDRRRGSILSIWKGTDTDEDGRAVIGHDDHEVDTNIRRSIEEDRLSPLGSSPGRTFEDRRRGSILSVWKGGKDERGNDVIAHEDHDILEVERKRSVDEGVLPPLVEERRPETIVTPLHVADVLVDDHDSEEESNTEAVQRQLAALKLANQAKAQRDRNIMSLWKMGKDVDGRHIVPRDEYDEIVTIKKGKIVNEERVEKGSVTDGKRGTFLSLS